MMGNAKAVAWIKFEYFDQPGQSNTEALSEF